MNTRSRVHGAAKKERERESFWMPVCIGVCVCTQTSLGPSVEDPCSLLTEEREGKSLSRALREVFGNEARVKIQS
jgi:hypothetical protein